VTRQLAVVTGCVLSVCILAVGMTPIVTASNSERVTVGPGANGSQRALDEGDLLVVRLPSNPSTGYAWIVRSGVGHVLRAAGRSYVPPSAEVVGAPGTAILRFRAATTGKTVLRLAYRRSWSSRAPAARTFVLHVTVT
jgi:inhibitor of cysteine peptidase